MWVQKNRRNVLILILGMVLFFRVSAVELTFKLTPTSIFPFFSSGNDKYAIAGGGAFLDTGATFFDLFNVGPEFGALFVPKQNSEELESGHDALLMMFPLGGHAEAVFYPFSRLALTAGVAGGACIGYTNGSVHYAPWYRGYGELAFRLNPQWELALNASWFDYQYDSWWGNPGAAGVTAGISVQYKFDTEKVSGEVNGTVQQDESVFPLFYTIYKNNPVGTVTVTNNETAEIHNVVVKFRAGNYTSSELECGRIKQIRKHHSEDIALYADFSDAILQFSEAGKIPGELVIEYELLGQKRTAVSQVIIPVYNRNQVRWTDAAVIASYISSNSQEVLELSKYLVGIGRNHLRSGLNRNMQFAMYLYEGIRLAGIECSADPSTPYIPSHLDPSVLDYIQYPFQTLLYKTGDDDDIGILYLALLESVGIKSAFIPMDDDFVVLIDLGITTAKAENLFDGFDRLMVIDGEAWIALSMSALREGFVNSWYKAVVALQQATKAGVELNLVDLEQAWQSYPPAGFSSGETINVKPVEADVTAAVETDVARYITAEFGPQIAAIQAQIKTEGPSAALYNTLGLLYVRAGMYSSAIPVYEQSAALGSAAAMSNLGNIAVLQKRFEEAKKWYEKALVIEPDNKSAQKGLNRVLGELEK